MEWFFDKYDNQDKLGIKNSIGLVLSMWLSVRLVKLMEQVSIYSKHWFLMTFPMIKLIFIGTHRKLERRDIKFYFCQTYNYDHNIKLSNVLRPCHQVCVCVGGDMIAHNV